MPERSSTRDSGATVKSTDSSKMDSVNRVEEDGRKERVSAEVAEEDDPWSGTARSADAQRDSRLGDCREARCTN